MARLAFDKVLDCFSLSISQCSCLCIKSLELEAKEDEYVERDSLIKSYDKQEQTFKLRDILEPKTVILRVSMHCGGCAKRVQKHIKKIIGVTSCTVDLDNKKVVVEGDITPFEVLDSVTKIIKYAELWVGPYDDY